MPKKAESHGTETDLIRQVTHLSVGADLDVNRELHRMSLRMGSASLMLDGSARVLALSPGVFRLFQLPDDTPRDALLGALLSRADQVRLKVFCDEVRRSAEARQWVGVDHRGEPVFVRVQPCVGPDCKGDDRLFVSLIHLQPDEDEDVGERANDARLYYRMSQLEIMLGALPTAVLLYEKDGDERVYGNWRCVKLFRMPPDSTSTQFVPLHQGQDIQVIDGEQALSLPAWVKRWVDDGGRARGADDAVILRLPDGETLEVVDGFAPLYDIAGEVRGCIATLTDITERRRLQREAETRLRQQRAIAELGLYAMAEPRLEAVLQECCRVAAETLHVEFARVMRLDERENHERVLVFAQGEGWDEDVVDGLVEPVSEELEAGRVLMTGQPMVVDHHGRDGRSALSPLLSKAGVVSSMSAPIRGPRATYGVLGIHSASPERFTRTDINFASSVATVISHALYREHYERRLAESRERLARMEADRQLAHAERLTSLGTLAAGIAHEINNPLNSIMMNAELAKMQIERGVEAAKLGDALDRIIEDCRRSARITKSVLSFARRDAERVREPVDVAVLFENSRKVLASVLQLSNLRIQADVAPNTPPILGSPTELEQILINLVKNSGEAGATRVSISAAPSDEMVGIEVEDDGPGISREDANQIFDPFFSTKRKAGGTGLGLSLVHRIVEDHDGEISVANLPSGGCRFEIRLPRADTDNHESIDRRG